MNLTRRGYDGSPATDGGGSYIEPDSYRLVVGHDHIVTRRNDRTIQTDRGMPVRNRAMWTVTAVERDGIVTATGPDGNIRLPAHYVWNDVELGYAQTVHGAQGATIDRSILVVDGPTDGRTLYVGLTRGAERNDVYVLAEGNNDPIDVLASSLAHDWADRPATGIHIDLVEQAVRDGWTVDVLAVAGWSGPGLAAADFTYLLRPKSVNLGYDAVQLSPEPPAEPEQGMGIEL